MVNIQMANCYNTAKQRNLDKTSAENPGITDIPSHRHGFAALFLTSRENGETQRSSTPQRHERLFSFVEMVSLKSQKLRFAVN